MSTKKPSPATRAIHHATRNVDGALNTPIYQSAAFLYEPFLAAGEGADGVYYYSRMANPSLEEAEGKLSSLIETEATLLTASGMGAITAAVLAHVGSGDHIIASNAIYGGALSLLRHLEQRFQVEVSWVAPESFAHEAEALATERTRMLYLESPTNPTLKLVELEPAATLGRALNAVTLLDHTFASPLLEDPAGAGIDLIVHSVTKYISGHSDLLAGSVSGTRERITAIRQLAHYLGAVCDPHTAFLVTRGIKTLGVRMERHCHNALALGRYLQGHSKVRRVHYPYLESHPQYALARANMKGGGGVLSFELDDIERAERFVKAVRVFKWAPSLGGVESLVHVPAMRAGSHGHWTVQERSRAGIADGLVRLAVGIEDEHDLIADLDQALGPL